MKKKRRGKQLPKRVIHEGYANSRDALEESFKVGEFRAGMEKTGPRQYRDYSLILQAERDKQRMLKRKAAKERQGEQNVQTDVSDPRDA